MIFGMEVIKDVQEKVQALKIPKRSSVRTALIYAGELDSAVVESEYFDRILDVGSLM